MTAPAPAPMPILVASSLLVASPSCAMASVRISVPRSVVLQRAELIRDLRAAFDAAGTLDFGHRPDELGARRKHRLTARLHGFAERGAYGVFDLARVRCEGGREIQRQRRP